MSSVDIRGSGGTAPEWHAVNPCVPTRIYSPVEDSQYTSLVFLQSDIFKIIKFPDNALVWNWAARADCAGLLPRMSRYPHSRSTVDHTSSIFLAAWLVPVPADSYRPGVRYKAKQNITEDDRNRIYYFYG